MLKILPLLIDNPRQRIHRNWARTKDKLVCLYNFKSEFLMQHNMQLKVISASRSTRLWTMLYIIVRSVIKRLYSSDSNPKNSILSLYHKCETDAIRFVKQRWTLSILKCYTRGDQIYVWYSNCGRTYVVKALTKSSELRDGKHLNIKKDWLNALDVHSFK